MSTGLGIEWTPKAQPIPKPPPWRGQCQRPAELDRYRRLTEAGAVFLVGLAVSTVMAAPAGGVPLACGVLSAVLSGTVAFEALRLTSPSMQNGAQAPAGLGTAARDAGIAACAAALSLCLQGVPWSSALAWTAGDAASIGAVLACLRASFAGRMQRMAARGHLATKVAVVGSGPAAGRAIARLGGCAPYLITVVGRYVDQDEDGVGLEPARGNLRTLLLDCRLQMVDAVVLAVPADREADLARLQALLRPCIQDIYLSAELMHVAGPDARAASLASTPLLLVKERPLKGGHGALKKVLDQAGASLSLLFLLPVLAIIALAIRIESPGPVLFKQLRVGYNNQLFHILKFRSMYHDAADRLAKQQTVHGDLRVTGVGRVIRKLSLDELPQLLNVVLGQMSLVGPRPHAPGTSVDGYRVHHLSDDYACRHLVRPGITGLAQVRGLRGGLHDRRQANSRLSADLEYIRRWSLWLDVKILLLTLVRELRGHGGV